ncbi:alcohol oxidase [Mycena filopes]|nr:alcohol oxidase [Mycena filopes]
MWPFTPSYPSLRPSDVGSPTVLPPEIDDRLGVYDYIVVGGGTAGAVVANRLSADPTVRVLLLERGGPVDTWAARVPLIGSAYFRPGAPVYRDTAVPMENLDARTLTMYRGKALGGGSRINGMGYTRGWAGEFNQWAAEGRVGWAYEAVAPFFMKSEGWVGGKLASAEHGQDGPWKTRVLEKWYLESNARCADAAEALGIPIINDVNGPHAPAVTCAKLQMTMDLNGRRCSTFDAFLPLRLALDRKAHLKICTGAVATRLDVQDGRVGGVFFVTESDAAGPATFHARARREVVVCCGAVGSPHLLMLSGIGPKAHLEDVGIKTVKDLPGVGSNLQDHFGICTMYRVPLKDTFHDMRDRPLRAAKEFLKYLISGDGLFLCPYSPMSFYLRSDLVGPDHDLRTTNLDPKQLDSTKPENVPDIEIMAVPVNSTDEEVPVGTGVFSLLTVLLRPRSRGTVRLESADPMKGPRCELGFLADAADRALARKAARISRRIGEEMRTQGYAMEALNFGPGADSDAELDAFINKNYRTTMHYSSTCRMAPEDDVVPGVVDDRLRVHGVRNLRIADCSIFPDIIANHPMATAVMVAEKCVHMILADAAAPV